MHERARTEVAAPDRSTETDELLALRAAADREAFADLYRRYLDPVYRFCYRRLGTREAAEDATSVIFARVLAAIPRYREGSFRSWIFSIAHNVVTDSHRSSRPVEPLDAELELIDWQRSPEELAIEREEGTAIRALLERLTADQRKVLELRLAGLTGPEIAEVLGRTRGWVNVTQFRATDRLRELLGLSRPEREKHRATRQ
jgi:RNA polymerase sigma-70 factor (ECF subfamily)